MESHHGSRLPPPQASLRRISIASFTCNLTTCLSQFIKSILRAFQQSSCHSFTIPDGESFLCGWNPLQGDSTGPPSDLHVGQTGCRSSGLGVSGQGSTVRSSYLVRGGHEQRNCRNLGSRTECATSSSSTAHTGS